jgi:LmbE family N-acetylglucosaminyl deacetylase
MKHIAKSQPESVHILVFGAHPDDIEFGCGGVLIKEALNGRRVHLVVCSRGESATHGTPAQRVKETKAAAAIMGASVEIIDLGGDAHFEVNAGNTIKLARMIRTHRPQIVLAPTLVENQHPDHVALAKMVRNAARIARYGGVKELRGLERHVIQHLFYYAVTPTTEPPDITPLLIDVSGKDLIETWKAAMEAHASQTSQREYVLAHLVRARMRGWTAGTEYAIPLYPNDPIVIESVFNAGFGARRY